MKKLTIFTAVFLSSVFLFAAILIGEGTHHEFDKATYDKLAKETIGMVVSGNVDVDKMMANVQKLVELGVFGCKEHMGEPETPETEKKIMKFTIEQVGKMVALSLEDIEALWHEGGFLKEQGIDIHKFDHYDEVMCHYDAVVHPATCIICLNEYKASKDQGMLEQIKAELSEVRQHIKSLE
jgi:hypothetical protein